MGQRFEMVKTANGYEEVAIRDWAISPSDLHIFWKEGEPIPSSHLVTEVFTDVENLKKYEGVEFEYRAIIFDDYANLFRFDNFEKAKDFATLPKNGKVQMKVQYSFNPSGAKYAKPASTIHFIIRNKKTKEVLEERILKGCLFYDTGNCATPFLDKQEYFITYDKAKKSFSGDTGILVNYKKIDKYAFGWCALKLYKNKTEDTNKTEDDVVVFNLDNARDREDLSGSVSIEGIKGVEQLSKGQYDFPCSAYCYGTLDDRQIAWGGIVPFWVRLRVIDSDSDFKGLKITKKHFRFTRYKDSEAKKAQGDFIVRSNSTVIAERTDLFSVTTTQLSSTTYKVSFSSLEVMELPVGEHQETIVVYNGYGLSATVKIDLTVISLVENAPSDVLFCLGNRLVVVHQKENDSVFVRLHLDMLFEGYGREAYAISQTYEYVFFEGVAKMFPGEEVQDFFMDIDKWEQIEEYDGEELMEVLMPSLMFRTAKVNIRIEEIAKDKTTVLATHLFNDIRYIPGKKPLAFPYLTNAKIRTSYSDSLLYFSALGRDMKAHDLGNIAGNNTDFTAIADDMGVYALQCSRRTLDEVWGKDYVAKNKYIAIEPIPNPRDCINVVFINQNLCPDWFAFSGEWEEHWELNHILSKHSERGVDFKVKAEEKDIFKLNTGWIFEEEIVLLKEMMQSKYCFVQLRGEWVRCISISKKSLHYDSERNVNSQIVEFQKVLEDER